MGKLFRELQKKQAASVWRLLPHLNASPFLYAALPGRVHAVWASEQSPGALNCVRVCVFYCAHSETWGKVEGGLRGQMGKQSR